LIGLHSFFSFFLKSSQIACKSKLKCSACFLRASRTSSTIGSFIVILPKPSLPNSWFDGVHPGAKSKDEFRCPKQSSPRTPLLATLPQFLSHFLRAMNPPSIGIRQSAVNGINEALFVRQFHFKQLFSIPFHISAIG